MKCLKNFIYITDKYGYYTYRLGASTVCLLLRFFQQYVAKFLLPSRIGHAILLSVALEP